MTVTVDVIDQEAIHFLRDLERIKLIQVNLPPVSPELEAAEEIWANNQARPEALRAKLQELRGSLPNASFGGLDGVSYQRKIRDEWDAG